MNTPQAAWTDAPAGNRADRPSLLAGLLRLLKIVALSLGVTIASIGAYWGGLQYQGNFHAVSAGTLYRSAQPSKDELGSAVRGYGIKSVLNLRGAHPGQAWYDEEVAAAGELGLVHYDIGLSAKRIVTAEQIVEILDILRRAPKPLLIHCKSGADRSGLVAALYRFAESGATAEEAGRELSLIYGHFPYLTSRSGAMDESLRALTDAAARRP